MKSSKIAIYHGNEEWVLKGIGQDLAAAFRSLGYSVNTTDKVFKKVRLNADYHVFVQQGQLNSNCDDNPNNVPEGAICLFTHLDVKNFKPKILHKCQLVVFNSSIQLSQAIANGYIPSNAILQPHAVDPELHQVVSHSDPIMKNLLDSIAKQGKVHAYKQCVGFCGRYWDKFTYTRRKNYKGVKDTIQYLIKKEIPVVVNGPGWSDYLKINSPYLLCIESKYKNYPYIYNLMRLFVSLSIHEGGPLPLLEAMSCGAYPIVTNTGFSFDIVESQKVGTIISPFLKSNVVANKIELIYNSNLNFDACRERASKFSFIKLAKTISSVFK